jgi:hypothetical protein
MSGTGYILNVHDAQVRAYETLEGENFMIAQQTTRFLLKAHAQARPRDQRARAEPLRLCAKPLSQCFKKSVVSFYKQWPERRARGRARSCRETAPTSRAARYRRGWRGQPRGRTPILFQAALFTMDFIRTDWSGVSENDLACVAPRPGAALLGDLLGGPAGRGAAPSGPPRAVKHLQRFPMQIGFLWRFCVGVQGA